MRTIRITFVDDEPRLRLAWQKLLATQTDLCVVAVLSETDDLDGSLSAETPDVLIPDLVMPGVDAMQLIRRVVGAYPTVKVLVYSAHSNAEIMREAFNAGARGYVDKLASPADMFTVLRRVADGDLVIPSWLATTGSNSQTQA